MEKANGLVIRSLTVGYGKQAIIYDQSITLPRGKITCLIGPNGCGKSTLLKSIGRVLKPHSGHISLDGMDVLTADPKQLARQMAYLPQSPTAPLGLTVQELVAYGRFPHQKPLASLKQADYEQIHWAINQTGLGAQAHQALENLSGGQRQRAWIAMALCQDTPYLLLDEPTTYLDLAHQLEVLNLLKTLNLSTQKTIVMVIHELNQAARFADYVVGMKDGQIIAKGAVSEVIQAEALAQIFGIEAHVSRDVTNSFPVLMHYDLIRTQ